jgi:hypothetical protein
MVIHPTEEQLLVVRRFFELNYPGVIVERELIDGTDAGDPVFLFRGTSAVNGATQIRELEIAQSVFALLNSHKLIAAFRAAWLPTRLAPGVRLRLQRFGTFVKTHRAATHADPIGSALQDEPANPPTGTTGD